MRYSRQEILNQVGKEGQAKLTKARVLLIGCGGLGNPIAPYLVGAGVGTILLVDNDSIEKHNLHRQTYFTEADIGKNKAEALKENLEKLNSEVTIKSIPVKLDASNIESYLADCDCVLDGTDNFATRYLVNDVCAAKNIPLVYGAVHKWDGQVAVFHHGENGNLRDIFPSMPTNAPSCEEEGILGPVAGIIGCAMALECLKVLIDTPVLKEYAIFNGLENKWNYLKLNASDWKHIDYRKEKYEVQCSNESLALRQIGTAHIVIDLREAYEKTEKEEAYLSIPFGEIQETLKDKDYLKGKIPVFYCTNTMRSQTAARWYEEVHNLKAYYLKS